MAGDQDRKEKDRAKAGTQASPAVAKVSYDKQVRQDAKWDSSFVGAIAIPDAINHYSEQFRLILLRLYRDPEFLKALRPAAKVATSGDATREAAPAT